MKSSVTASKILWPSSKKLSSKNAVKPAIKAVNEPLSSINWETGRALVYDVRVSQIQKKIHFGF